jgi:acetylornithine deacetylase/succinyl-diaminopimelate desuccinylase-like protein
MDDFKAIYPRIHRICEAHSVTTKLLVSDPPCINDTENSYIKPFRELIQTVTGKEPGVTKSYGATDGRYFSAHGIPCIITTPEGEGRHTDEEWLSAKGLKQFDTILESYIKRMATDSEHH